MKRYLAALLMVLGLLGVVGALAVGVGYAKDENDARAKCSEATLEGTYPFAFNGVQIKGNNDQAPFAIAGYAVFDGNGKEKGVVSSNFNGEVSRKEPVSGTYTVKADCTGTLTFADGSQIDLFIAPDGSMFTFIQTKPSRLVGSGFQPRGRPSESESEPLRRVWAEEVVGDASPLYLLFALVPPASAPVATAQAGIDCSRCPRLQSVAV